MRRLLPLLACLLAVPAVPASAQLGDEPRPGGSAGRTDVHTIATRPGDLLDDPAPDIDVPDIDFTQETLDNGLRVIYAPLDNAPVVHVRVFYHVGSKDESRDRQGFAHMFEHMMFRGSEHVPSEQHMKLVNGVGGNSNAFTSFDQTVYVNTVPANALEMALWLEADRMASFKVDEETFTTERNVVNEEYLQRVKNPPYGQLFIDFFDLAFGGTSYGWTPIGDMEQLRQSTPEELQGFFDTYYVPNNAVLVVAGDFDRAEAERWVKDYFGWIPRGEDVARPSFESLGGDGPRREVVYAPSAPLTRLTMGFTTPGYGGADEEAIAVLGNVLGQGRSSRLYQALVAGAEGEPPVANFASAGGQQLEGTGLFFVSVGVLPGQDPDAVEDRTMEALKRVAEEGVSDDEVARAKTQLKLSLLQGRQTADSIAGELADNAAFNDDPGRVNTAADRLDAVTPQDVKRVAKQYLVDENLTVLQYRPGEAPATRPATDGEATPPRRNVPVQQAPATRPGAMIDRARDRVTAAGEDIDSAIDRARTASARTNANGFPADYPTTAPVPADVIEADFDMGDAFEVGPLTVVAIEDDRLPLVGMTLILPGGGDAIAADKLGLASLTADLITRGAGDLDAAAFSEALEGLGISLSASDGGDHTRLGGSFPAGAMDDAAGFASLLLTEPAMDEREFTNLKFRALAGLRQALSSPPGVAARELDAVLYGDAPAGRSADLKSIGNVELADAQAWFADAYTPDGGTLILAGDVTRADAERFAKTLLDGWQAGGGPLEADYGLGDYGRGVVIVDNPGGGQSSVRLGNRAFTNDSPEKYAASVATQILSGGIESRLNIAMRAEKGLTYGAGGRFDPGRHAGGFTVGFDTKPATTAEAITTAHEVLRRMAGETITDAELAEAKRRVTGSLVLATQTVGQLAGLRGSIALNDYPLDYYQDYADRIAEVTAEDVRRVIADYGDPADLSIVVVGPAEVVREQVAEFGDVTVVPMPLARE